MDEDTKGPSVKLVLDSCNPLGIRLCTWELKYARFVHAELMTHRIGRKEMEVWLQSVLDTPSGTCKWRDSE